MNYYTFLESPLDPLLLVSDGEFLTGIYMETEAEKLLRHKSDSWHEDAAPFTAVIAQLKAYFARELHEFDLPLKPAGTDFQKTVWQALQTIPYGKTVSYGAIAKAIKAPGASRAVGLANNQNPISIVIPCHRVIGSNGEMIGYGGGIHRKQWLLAHESTQQSMLF